jgi:hypothetical protein
MSDKRAGENEWYRSRTDSHTSSDNNKRQFDEEDAHLAAGDEAEEKRMLRIHTHSHPSSPSSSCSTSRTGERRDRTHFYKRGED